MIDAKRLDEIEKELKIFLPTERASLWMKDVFELARLGQWAEKHLKAIRFGLFHMGSDIEPNECNYALAELTITGLSEEK